MKLSSPGTRRDKASVQKNSVVIDAELESAVVSHDESLLERSQTQWQFGDWERLSQIDKDSFRHHPDRARLAALVAAGNLQINNQAVARQYLKLAHEWGCSKRLMVQILTAGALNNLGRAAALAGDMPRALRHFESAIMAGAPGTDTRLISKARSTEQLAQVQRLTDCATHKVSMAHICIREKIDTASSSGASLPKSETYDQAFYDAQKHGSELSAREVLPVLFRYFKPRTLIDVGCGVGTWVKVAKQLGVELAVGVDGFYATGGLVIPEASFVSHDLGKPLGNFGRFDLAMSLEVAEHLDPVRADGFVSDLCGLSDTVLFSAAIPHQGGTDHRNENWPEYWARKFERHGYVPLDFLRETLWNNSKVEWWYRQNILIFVREALLEKVFVGMAKASPQYLTRIHPDLLIKRATKR